MKLFHGTTYNRFKKMQESGYIGSCNTIWNVSAGDTTYFYTEEHLKEEVYDVEDADEIKGLGVRMARESAEIALCQEQKNLKRVVLVLDSEDLDQDLLSVDDSSDGMEHCMQHTGLIPLSKVKEIYMDEEFLDLFALYFIGMAYERNSQRYSVCSIYMGENEHLSSTVLKGAQQLYQALCLDWLEDISYQFELELLYNSETNNLISPVDIEVLN